MKITPIIRQATLNDHQGMMIYALKLLRQHQNFNNLRFVQFENHEERLFDFFKAEITNPKAIVLVVELEQKIVGYSFIRIEESSLAEISPEAAWLHDIFIDEKARGFGAGKLLLDAAIASAQKLGANRMMLQVAAQNEFAKKLFELNGFEVSTYEMIKDIS
jgi:ribosomal protein S18 acetylase RimI-like enzyme